MNAVLKDIAVLFDASQAGKQTLSAAARLAGEQQSHLIGVTALAQDPGSRPESFAKGNAINEVIVRHRSVMAARALELGESLTQAIRAHQTSGELRIISYANDSSASSLQALYCDLLVVGHPDISTSPLAWTTPQILRESGIPLLIVPSTWADQPIGRHILLASNGSRQSRRAIADALPLLSKAEKVTLLVVNADEKPKSPEDLHAPDLSAYLQRHQVLIEEVRIDAHGEPVAEVILAQAKLNGCDLIVFGAYSRPKLSEAIFGGVTRTLLRQPIIPLFVSQ